MIEWFSIAVRTLLGAMTISCGSLFTELPAYPPTLEQPILFTCVVEMEELDSYFVAKGQLYKLVEPPVVSKFGREL